MERRVKKSDPDFEKLFNLANDLAIAMNPQRWFNLAGPEKRDFAEPERLTVVAEIRNQFGLPKSTAWRLMRRLEREELVEITKFGNQNMVRYKLKTQVQ